MTVLTHQVIYYDTSYASLIFKFSLTFPAIPRRDHGVSYTDGSWGHDYTEKVISDKAGQKVYICGDERNACLHRTATCSTQGKGLHTATVPLAVARALLAVLKQKPNTATHIGICRSCLALSH